MVELVGMVLSCVGALGLWGWCIRTGRRGRVGDRLGEVWGPVVVGLVLAGFGFGVGYLDSVAGVHGGLFDQGIEPRYGVGYAVGLLGIVGLLVACIAIARAEHVRVRFGSWLVMVVCGGLVGFAVLADSLAVLDGLLLLLVGLCWAWWRGGAVEHEEQSLLGDRVDAGWVWAVSCAVGLGLWRVGGGGEVTAWVAVASTAGVMVLISCRGSVPVGLSLCAGWVGLLGGAGWGRWVGSVVTEMGQGSGVLFAVSEATLAQPAVIGVGGGLAEVVIGMVACASGGLLGIGVRDGRTGLGRLLVLPCLVVLLGFVVLRWWWIWIFGVSLWAR